MRKSSEKTSNSERKLEKYSLNQCKTTDLNLWNLKVENNYLMLLAVHDIQKITASKVL